MQISKFKNENKKLIQQKFLNNQKQRKTHNSNYKKSLLVINKKKQIFVKIFVIESIYMEASEPK